MTKLNATPFIIVNKLKKQARLSLKPFLSLFCASLMLVQSGTPQVAYAEPNDSVSTPSAETNAEKGQVKIVMGQFETPEQLEASPQGKLVDSETSTNLVTFVKTEDALKIEKTWGHYFKNKSRRAFYYLEYPVKKLSQHVTEQIGYYKREKLAVAVFSVLTAGATLNYFVFTDEQSLATKSLLLAVNSVLYFYLTVNVDNWKKILGASEEAVERFRHQRAYRRSKTNASENQSFKDYIMNQETFHKKASDQVLANLAANFTFFMTYNFIMQGIINWGDLETMFSQDLLKFMLTNSILGVASSGIWDSVFRKWYLEGKVTDLGHRNLTWIESVTSATIHSLISVGISQGYIGLIASGVTGASALVVTSEKFKNSVAKVKNGAKWTLQKGRVLASAINFLKPSPEAAAQMCMGYLK